EPTSHDGNLPPRPEASCATVTGPGARSSDSSTRRRAVVARRPLSRSDESARRTRAERVMVAVTLSMSTDDSRNWITRLSLPENHSLQRRLASLRSRLPVARSKAARRRAASSGTAPRQSTKEDSRDLPKICPGFRSSGGAARNGAGRKRKLRLEPPRGAADQP